MTGAAIVDLTWKNAGIVLGTLAAFGTLIAATRPVLQSDPPPFASISRVEDVSSEVIAGHIDDVMRDYCASELSGNRSAEIAEMRDVSDLETRYASLNDGKSWPLSPCP